MNWNGRDIGYRILLFLDVGLESKFDIVFKFSVWGKCQFPVNPVLNLRCALAIEMWFDVLNKNCGLAVRVKSVKV